MTLVKHVQVAPRVSLFRGCITGVFLEGGREPNLEPMKNESAYQYLWDIGEVMIYKQQWRSIQKTHHHRNHYFHHTYTVIIFYFLFAHNLCIEFHQICVASCWTWSCNQKNANEDTLWPIICICIGYTWGSHQYVTSDTLSYWSAKKHPWIQIAFQHWGSRPTALKNML